MARATDVDGYPMACHHCDRPVRRSDSPKQPRDIGWYEHDHDTGEQRSWHFPCRLAARIARTVG